MENTLTSNVPGRLSFEKRILIFFFLVLFLIAVIVFLFIKINADARRTKAGVVHTEKIVSLADSMVTHERNIVIGTRSFLITANENYLKTYSQDRALLDRNLERLRGLTRENADQQKRLDSLKEIFQQYSAVREKTLSMRKQITIRFEKGASLIEESDQLLARINAIFTTVQEEEKRSLAERKTRYQENLQLTGHAVRILLVTFVLSILLAFIIVYRNSLKRTRAERALRKSEELVRGIIQYAPVLVTVKDEAGKYIMVNNQFAMSLGSSPEEMLGKTSEQILEPETAERISQEDREVLQTGQVAEFEVKLPTKDGVQTYLTSKFPLCDFKGKPFAVAATAFDITPLMAAHGALRNSYERQQKILNGLQQALSTSSDLLCIINERGEFVMLTDTAAQLVGYTPKELMSKKYIDFVAEEDKATTAAIANRIMAGEPVSDFTNHYRKKDGSLIPIIWSATWLPEEKTMYCIARNGTEKIKTAYELSQSQARLLHAQKIAQLGNWDWDLKTKAWSCSEEIYHLLGTTPRQTGDIQKLLLESIHPEDRPLLFAARDRALKRGQPIDIEHRIIRSDGEIRFVHTKGEVSFDSGGCPIWFSGTLQDITDRKKAELQLQNLNADLEKRAVELNASNAELERFAYVASHDLQEPLRMVTSFLALLQKKHRNEFDETSQKYIHFAVDGAERMKGLIQDLLQYSRLGSSREAFDRVDLNDLLNEVRHVYEQAINEQGGKWTASNLPVVTGNKLLLYQLFQNLVGNALKYRGEENPVIAIGCSDRGNEWQFFVKDNGIGIDPRYFDKIFIIFQRLHNKTAYSGTGIGLAICKKIVERHGGRIWVESHPGQGSTFYFTLQKTSHDARGSHFTGGRQ